MQKLTNLREMLEFSASEYGDQPAYLYKTRTGGAYIPISFKEFKEIVFDLGTALKERGFMDCRMAVIGENRWEWIAAHLAVSCGLGVIVPLDKELPAHEIAALIRRAGVNSITYSAKIAARLREALAILAEEGVDTKAITLISMDVPPEGIDALYIKDLITEGENLRSGGNDTYETLPIDPDEMRILLFTSGTTGLAKGVMMSHRNLCVNVQQTALYVDLKKISSGRVGLSLLPMHHTYEFSADVLGSLYQGGTLAFCEGLKHIVKNMQEAEVSYLIAVPLIFESMHKKIWKKAEKSGKAEKMRAALKMIKAITRFGTLDKKLAGKTKKLFKEVHEGFGGKLSLLIAGAAPIDPGVISDFNAMGFTMVQGYGMTECAPIIALNPTYANKPAAAGLPLPGTEVYIDQPDESGVGEIVCRSQSVMLGYYMDPEETAKVLSDDGWLKTGDYGYMDAAGYVYITGRKKNVIVTKNGKNIFPEEVEFYLGRSPYILETVVSGRPSDDGTDLVVTAEIFPDYDEAQKKAAEEGISLEQLIRNEVEKANDAMPAYKRVRSIVLRESEFEKTTTKKIKRW
ncbi:MAG: AMP-binding protein [Firmicutes bacterium]|nr:AMP-binding protein [Bacillota bacterium]